MNPGVHVLWGGPVAIIYFNVPGGRLYWTGNGFKREFVASPKEYPSKEEAEKSIREEILDFIRKWRSDQVNLIRGW